MYGSAAIQHLMRGNWFLPDSFNPAVAMPIWPLMLGAWFEITGPGMAAARLLTLLVYGISLLLFYLVVRSAITRKNSGSLFGMLAIALMTVNPFCYAFDRLAILEPVMVLWLMLGLWMAGRTCAKDFGRQLVLGAVLSLLVLTKTPGIFLAPAILYQLAATIGWEKLRWLRPVCVAAGTAVVLWLIYYFLAVRPHHLEDYLLLFAVNQDRVHLSIVPETILKTLWGGMSINRVIFPVAVVLLIASVVWMRELWRVPLFGSSVIAATGYLMFVCYHSNLQPRYYLVVTMPLVAGIVLGLECLWARSQRLGIVLAGVIGFAMVMMMVQTVRYTLHPEYSFLRAAQGIALKVHGDGSRSGLLLSSSGADITLFTGIASLGPDYNRYGLAKLLDRYQPNWYAAWQGWDDDRTELLKKQYVLQEMARYPVFDDPRRDVLVLYSMKAR